MFDHPAFSIIVLIDPWWQVCIGFSWLFIKVWLQWRQNDEQSTTSQFPTKKPVCPACQAEERLTLPSMPPPALEYARGRPRDVTTSALTDIPMVVHGVNCSVLFAAHISWRLKALYSVYLRLIDLSAVARDSTRSATEGFIAVAKHLRGFGKSLYRGFQGDRIWTLLCQTASNLKKFLQLYREGRLEENSLLCPGLPAQ